MIQELSRHGNCTLSLSGTRGPERGGVTVTVSVKSPSKNRSDVFETDIPARLDRLPWSRFHWLLVTALGITWVLDGLEVTVVGSVGPFLKRGETLGLSDREVGLAGSLYLAGAIGGALLFGHLTDRLGRKRLFTITLGVYLTGVVFTACSWEFWTFSLFRALTGMAIGGEYAAINSAIDELIPARVRGRVDLIVNGTFWAGAAAGALASLVLLNPHFVPVWLGWRLAFGVGALVGVAMILARHNVPESPRWLLMHGRQKEAEKIMDEIEIMAVGRDGRDRLPPIQQRLTFRPTGPIGFGTILHTLLVRYRGRAVLGLVLISSQAFFYNGITFTYPLVLDKFFHVRDENVPRYALLFAAGNFFGPIALGHLFDTIGRRTMITATYALSGVLIAGIECLFLAGWLTAETQTLLWAGTCFFASSAASAGYLTVSEVFPLEMRALAIALFYVIGTAVGGLVAPFFFGTLIETGKPGAIATGYLIGAGLMILAAATEMVLGIATERKSLEDIATPLMSEDATATSS
jgi:MFS family permease